MISMGYSRLALEPCTQSCDPYTPGLFAMRINIEIDNRLLTEVLRSGGAQTRKAAVEVGLRLLVKTHSQTAIPHSELVDH
jgi:hypothetical protein